MNPENHEKANLRQNPRESHDMTTSSTARAQGRADRRTQSVCDCAESVRPGYLPEFDPGLFEFH